MDSLILCCVQVKVKEEMACNLVRIMASFAIKHLMDHEYKVAWISKAKLNGKPPSLINHAFFL